MPGQLLHPRLFLLQVTAIANPDPERYAQDASRECPDFAAAATPAQLKGSEDYVLFVCAALGEIMLSSDNWVKLDPYNQDPTCNVKLQVSSLTASVRIRMQPSRRHSLHAG